MEPQHPLSRKEASSVWMLFAVALVVVASVMNAQQPAPLRPNVALTREYDLRSLQSLDSGVLNALDYEDLNSL
jgi:hypothetical protein